MNQSQNNPREGDDKSIVLFPTHEEAVAFVDDEGFPIKNVLVGVTRPFASYSVNKPANGKFHLLEYVLSGEGELFLNGKTHKLRQGVCYVVLKNDPRRYRSSSENPLKKIWICFSSDYLEATMKAYGLSSGVYRANVESNFSTVYNLSKSDRVLRNVFFALEENLHQIILALAASSIERENDGATLIKNALVARVYSKCNLEEVANELFTSKANLIRVFKKAFGITPYQFLLEEKIKIAKTLLKTTSTKIKAISDDLRFTDEHYFSFHFKRKTGLTPSEYRRKNQL